MAVVEDSQFLERVLEVRDDLPALRHLVAVEDVDSPGVESWGELLSAAPVGLEAAAAVAEPHDLATIIYTSGTTGPPKGVMLDHHNICWTVDSLREALGVRARPLAHRVVPADGAHRRAHHHALRGDRVRVRGHHVPRHPTRSVPYLAETRPQIFFGVPRTFEKIHSTVQAVLAADPGRAEVFAQALEIGARVAAHRARGEALSVELAAEYEKVDAESLRPARQLLGLDDATGRGHVGRADPRRGAAVLPQRSACPCRSSTACRSRPGP